MSTFVSVGTALQPFTRLLNAVAELAPTLPQPVVVQCGYTPFQSASCVIRPFVPVDEYTAFITEAELVIMQAGGGGTIQAISAGKKPVVMPRRADRGEGVDDHQVAWGRHLAAIDKAVVAEEPADLCAAIKLAMVARTCTPAMPKQPPLVDIVAEILARCVSETKSGDNKKGRY